MISPQITLIVIMVAMAVLYITRWIPSEATSLLVIGTLVLTGLLSTEQAFSGFSSTATVTVAAMFVLSAGLLRTGALKAVSAYLVQYAGRSVRRLIFLMSLFIPGASAFINNTPVVVMMVPILLSVSRRLDLRPSKLMLPLSYLSILGGTATLLGTSTNILVDDLYRNAGGPGFGLFEFMPLGLIFTAVGTLYLVIFSRDLLPNRAPLTSLVTNRRQSPYVTELAIQHGSQLPGTPITRIFPDFPPLADRNNKDTSRPERENSIELLVVYRNDFALTTEQAAESEFQEGDRIFVAGTPDQIEQFSEECNTTLATVLEDNRRVPMADIHQKVVEAVVLPDSPFVGRLVGEIGLNHHYQIKVMGLSSLGQQYSSGLRSMRLQSGNILLLQGQAHMLGKASEENKLLLVDGVDKTIVRSHKNRASLLVMACVIVAATFGLLPISILAILGAATLLITQCLKISEAVSALNVDTLLLLAATIPMGKAIETTGMAETIVNGLLLVSQAASPIVFLSVFYLLTNLLTQLISNNAVAVLFTPVALLLAAEIGIDPKPLLVAIAFGASASFLTPMGYQTNAIVLGPGAYNFGDYFRLGMPISIIMWLIATVCIPIFWPL